MQRYQQRGIMSPTMGPLAILLILVGAAIIGGLVYLISKEIYLICIFPFVIGMALGFIMRFGVILGNIRNVPIFYLIAIIASVVLYAASRYPSYVIDYPEDVSEILERESPPGTSFSDEDIQEAGELLLKEETGDTGYLAFVELEAQAGFTITEGGLDDGVLLDYELAYMYWLVDFLIIAGTAIYIARGRTKTPFSEKTGQWYEQKQYLGTVAYKQGKDFWGLMEKGDVNHAREMMVKNQQLPLPRVDVFLMGTDNPEDEMVITYKEVKQGKYAVEYDETYKYGVIDQSTFQILNTGD